MRPRTRHWYAVVVCCALLLVSHAVVGQQRPSESGKYTPSVGQIGKDVIWVPTPEPLVERMLEIANVGPEDYVIDLGSGDGRTVIAAAEKFGARARGIEYNPDLVALSRRNAELAGVADKVQFVEADIFESDFSQATVIAMYLLPTLNLKLRPTILEMPAGTRVVSNSFGMADWRPDQTVMVQGRTAYLWIVPARVAGNWLMTLATEGRERTSTLRLDQKFQMLSGQIQLPDGWFSFVGGRVRGTEFRFDVIDANGKREVSGRVSGDHLEGTVEFLEGTPLTWSAVPAEKSVHSGKD